MSLGPEISGTLSIRSSAESFAEALRGRVAAGLLTGRRDSRSNHRMDAFGRDELHLRAADWPTAISIGLNDVILRVSPGSVRYEIRFWRWASYVLALSGALGLIGVVLLLGADVRGYIAHAASSRIPGLSIDQNVLILWAFVLFWGAVWPWLLIAIHKRLLRRLIARIVAEVDASGPI